MGRQLTTALSDAVLAASCYIIVYHIWLQNIYAGLGFSMEAIAATVGVFRFAFSRPSNTIVRTHDYMSWLTAVAGMPLIAVGFCKYILPYMMNFNFMASMGLILTNNAFDMKTQKLCKWAVTGLAMLTVLLSSYYTWNVHGFAAAGVYILSGRFIGSTGFMSIGSVRMPKLDVYHYALTVGNYLFFKALYNI